MSTTESDNASTGNTAGTPSEVRQENIFGNIDRVFGTASGRDAPLTPREIGRDFAGLPMPRNIGLLDGESGRPRVLGNRQHKRFPFPVPNGWFIVARADELKPGEVMPLYAFARNLVAFRTESGAPRVMDAHCPHLGAHLGVGGRVRGETIQCPFHGWRFQGEDGTCVEVPYDEVDFIPRKAHARAYPTIERN